MGTEGQGELTTKITKGAKLKLRRRGRGRLTTIGEKRRRPEAKSKETNGRLIGNVRLTRKGAKEGELLRGREFGTANLENTTNGLRARAGWTTKESERSQNAERQSGVTTIEAKGVAEGKKANGREG